jgi:hypothetical protein
MWPIICVSCILVTAFISHKTHQRHRVKTPYASTPIDLPAFAHTRNVHRVRQQMSVSIYLMHPHAPSIELDKNRLGFVRWCVDRGIFTDY